MGSMFSDLVGREALISQTLIGCNPYSVTLNDLRELHTTTQNLLKSLTLTSSDFEEIFECNSFSIWDIDNNGLISSIEVLCGLSMLSSTSSKDKLSCTHYLVIFSLFDFNNEASITICDLQVLLHLSVLSLSKIFGQFKDIGPHEVIEITKGYELSHKIDLPQMLEICLGDSTVVYFLSICDILKASSIDKILKV